METEDRIELLKNRIIEHIQKNTMDISSELQIFEVIAKKYQMKTITNYGNNQIPPISYNGVLDRIKNKRCASFQIDKIFFCCL